MKKMNKTKIKTLFAGILATILLFSTPVFAATNTSTTPNPMYHQYYDGTVYAINVHVGDTFTYNGHSLTNIGITMSDNSHIGIYAETSVGYNNPNDDLSIAALQILLNHYGYGLPVTGVFDTATFDALSSFQSNHSDCGSTSGVCDKQTWISLANNF